MRTKDELFRAAQREVAAYRQQAVMQAETARRAAYAAHPALAEAAQRPPACGAGPCEGRSPWRKHGYSPRRAGPRR